MLEIEAGQSTSPQFKSSNNPEQMTRYSEEVVQLPEWIRSQSVSQSSVKPKSQLIDLYITGILTYLTY
jgi:hypothetical protein